MPFVKWFSVLAVHVILLSLNAISEKNQTEQAIADCETLKTLSFPRETFQA